MGTNIKRITTFIKDVKEKYTVSIISDSLGMSVSMESKRPSFKIVRHISYSDLPKDRERMNEVIYNTLEIIKIKLDDMIEQSFTNKEGK